MTSSCANHCMLERFSLAWSLRASEGHVSTCDAQPPSRVGPLIQNPAPIVFKVESTGRVIGASDRRYKKYELDSLEACLYRLRVREETVD